MKKVCYETYRITIEWEIHHTNKVQGFRTGTSVLECQVKDMAELINHAIDFANSIPSWELKKNNIDLQDYRPSKLCCYYYRTQLSKIIKIEEVEQ